MKVNKELYDQVTCSIKEHPEIKNIAAAHIESFNYAMTDVLKVLPKYMQRVDIEATGKATEIFKTMSLYYDEFELGYERINIESLSKT